jgi:hypothetical protein
MPNEREIFISKYFLLIQEKIGKKFEFIFEERKVIPNKI